jgi:TonB-dependent receptor
MNRWANVCLGRWTKKILLRLPVFAGLGIVAAIAPAVAQEENQLEEITVTGIRASLAASADAKRDIVNFSDSIFAEDIGKFPDNNLAEAINRIPGIQLSRSVSGEGANISIRGLGPSFTQVLLNGNQISVATDTGGSNRAVDMDMFPVELFSKLTVYKTTDAHTTEGGVAGTVNIVNVRPFDNPNPGFHVAYTFQDGYADSGGTLSPRGALIASQNWDNKFGVLFGVAAQHFQYRTDGYENIGTDIVGIVDQEAALGQPVCPASICGLNTTASKNFHWASVVPPGISAANAAAYGLGPAGTPYNYAGPGFTTPGGTSGLSVQDLSNAIWPHLPRFAWRPGVNDRLSFLTALEYRPSDDLHFNLDMLYERSKKFQHLVDDQEFNRQSCNLQGTNGPTNNGVGGDNCQVPVNVKLDSSNIVTSATLLNSSWFMDNTENTDHIYFVDINPSMEWRVAKWLKLNGSAYFDGSHMDRDMMSMIFQTAPGSGLVTTYRQTPGADFPTMQTNAPLNDPNGGWLWYATRAQPVYRTTITKGSHWEATFGDEKTNLRVGYAYDQQYRNIINHAATQDMGNCIAMGASATSPCVLPDGTVEPLGTPAFIPNSAIPQYLIPGPSNFLGLSGQNPGVFGAWYMGNLNKLLADTKVRQFEGNGTIVPMSAGGGSFEEKTHGFYVEANGTTQFLERDFRFNTGVRYVHTDQALAAPLFLAGGVQTAQTKRGYDAFLPSLNVSANIRNDLIFRLSGARTMTRANPSFMLPGSSFPTASLSPINAGNPDLQPYFSDNVDLGLEWYTGGPGILAINAFSKDISNFTASASRQVPFGTLGIPTSALSPTQLPEYNSNGQGADVVTVNSQVNLQQKLHIRGYETQWVQPLDFLVRGVGLTANYSRVFQSVDPGLTANVAQSIATGIAPYAYNLGAYYEAHHFSVHVTYNVTAAFVSVSSPAYSGIPQAQYMDKHKQVDLSSSYTIPWLDGTKLDGFQITFDAINLNNEKLFSYVGDRNAVVSAYYPGRTYLLGFRGKL